VITPKRHSLLCGKKGKKDEKYGKCSPYDAFGINIVIDDSNEYLNKRKGTSKK
jgi:hypothetical protein